MSGSSSILFVALLLRACGAAVRKGNPGLPARGAGWVLSATAAWLAAGAAGAWFPVWPVLVLGGTGSLINVTPGRPLLYIAGDVVVVLLAGLLSIPPLDLVPLVGTVIGAAGVGFVIDSMMNACR